MFVVDRSLDEVLTMTEQKPKVIPLTRQDDSPILSLNEAAAYLKISKTQALHLIKGKFKGPVLRHARAGHRILIKRSWIDAWLEEAARQD